MSLGKGDDNDDFKDERLNRSTKKDLFALSTSEIFFPERKLNGLREVLKEGIKAENTPILLSRSKSDQKIHDFCVNTFLFFTFLEEIFTLGFF